MALFDPATIDFHGEEVKALAETIFEGFFDKPGLSAFHKIVPGIKARKQVIILSAFTGLIGLGAGECDPTPNESEIDAVQKFWEPAAISDRFAKCWSGAGGLEESFWIWGTNNGIDKYDLTATEYFLFLQDLITDAMLECIYRLAWLGDVNADTYANSGVLTDGTPLAGFNRIDGFWVQFVAIVAANSARKISGSTVTTRNAAANYAAQAFTSTDTTNRVVTEAFQELRYKADLRLRSRADQCIICTQSMADQYERELKAQQKVYDVTVITDGITMLKSDGIEIYVFSFLDRMINSYFNNGTKWYLPHRAVLTTKTNLQIGTEEEGNFSTFDVFYDKVTKKNYVDFLFNEDAMVALDHLVQLVY